MATRADETPAFPFGISPLWHSLAVVIWVIWAALTVNEYVGDSFGLPAFLLALLAGVLFGVAVFAWFARTEHGEKARRLYSDAPLGQQFAVSIALLVPLAALGYVLATANVSLVLLQVAFFSALLSYQQSKFASAYSRLG